MIGDMTTLPRAKAWLGIGVTPSIPDNGSNDALLGRLITQASAFVLAYVQRATFATKQVTERYDTGGNEFMLLRQWPVQSVSSISMPGRTITQQGSFDPWTPGFILEPQASAFGAQQLTLVGHRFPAARQAVAVTYTCGYAIAGEMQQVPSSDPFSLTPNFGWLADEGVTYANGDPLTAVAGVPAVGQYAAANGVYTFNAADAGAQVLLGYSYVPADVEQAVIELVGERFKQKDRIGKNSESQGGQTTTSYQRQDMSPYIATVLEPYRRTTPN